MRLLLHLTEFHADLLTKQCAVASAQGSAFDAVSQRKTEFVSEIHAVAENPLLLLFRS